MNITVSREWREDAVLGEHVVVVAESTHKTDMVGGLLRTTALCKLASSLSSETRYLGL